MAKVFSGRDGVMQVSGATIAKVASFSVPSNLETLETTTLGDNLRNYTPGVLGYSGSCTLLYYKEDSGSRNTASLLSKLVMTGTDGVSSSDTVQLTFRWLDGLDNYDIQLTAYVTSANIGATTGDVSRAEIAFIGTGELLAASI